MMTIILLQQQQQQQQIKINIKFDLRIYLNIFFILINVLFFTKYSPEPNTKKHLNR